MVVAVDVAAATATTDTHIELLLLPLFPRSEIPIPGMQSNPPLLGSRLWFTSHYMRAGAEGLGEGAYCLTQLSSALEFASHADASVLADITEDELNEVLYDIPSMFRDGGRGGRCTR